MDQRATNNRTAVTAEIAIGLGLFWSCQAGFVSYLDAPLFLVNYAALAIFFFLGCLDSTGCKLIALFEKPAVVALAYMLYMGRSLVAIDAPGDPVTTYVGVILAAAAFAFLQCAWFYTIGSRVQAPGVRYDYLPIASAYLVAAVVTGLVESVVPSIGVAALPLVRIGAAVAHCHLVATAPVVWRNTPSEAATPKGAGGYRPELWMCVFIVVFGALFALTPSDFPMAAVMGLNTGWAVIGNVTAAGLAVALWVAGGSGMWQATVQVDDQEGMRADDRARSDDALIAPRTVYDTFDLFPIVAVVGIMAVGFGILGREQTDVVFPFALGLFTVYLNAYILDSANRAGQFDRSVFASCFLCGLYYLGSLLGGVASVIGAHDAEVFDYVLFAVALLALTSYVLLMWNRVREKDLAEQKAHAQRNAGVSAEAEGQRVVAGVEASTEADADNVGADTVAEASACAGTKATAHTPDTEKAPSNIVEARDALVASHGLSEREGEVLLLLLQGWPHKKIAEELYIAPSTVKVHARRIYEKLGVHSRAELLDLLG